MQEEFVFAGFGGQGVMFIGQLLAYTAMDEGLHVTWIPSYGPEMRGGTAHCTVAISDKPIGSPLVQYPKVAVVFNNPSYDRYMPLASKLLAYNTSLIDRTCTRDDIQVLPVPASALADDLGNIKLMNMVLLGAVLAAYPVVTVEAVARALPKHMPDHRRDLLDLNLQALNMGQAYLATI